MKTIINLNIEDIREQLAKQFEVPMYTIYCEYDEPIVDLWGRIVGRTVIFYKELKKNKSKIKYFATETNKDGLKISDRIFT